MISLVILLVVAMAVMQMGIVSMGENVKNAMRDEAVSVAEMRLSQFRNLPFDNATLNATAGIPDGTINRSVRGAVIPFNLTRIISNVDTNTKLITERVDWQIKQTNYSH